MSQSLQLVLEAIGLPPQRFGAGARVVRVNIAADQGGHPTFVNVHAVGWYDREVLLLEDKLRQATVFSKADVERAIHQVVLARLQELPGLFDLVNCELQTKVMDSTSWALGGFRSGMILCRLVVPTVPTNRVRSGVSDLFPQGSHRHQCPACRTTWEHGNDCKGDAAAHQCPGCHRDQRDWYEGVAEPTHVGGCSLADHAPTPIPVALFVGGGI